MTTENTLSPRTLINRIRELATRRQPAVVFGPAHDLESYELWDHEKRHQLTPSQIESISESCRDLFRKTWPQADEGRIDQGVRLVAPYVTSLATGERLDWKTADELGEQLRKIVEG
jgi:hypothetical protein